MNTVSHVWWRLISWPRSKWFFKLIISATCGFELLHLLPAFILCHYMLMTLLDGWIPLISPDNDMLCYCLLSSLSILHKCRKMNSESNCNYKICCLVKAFIFYLWEAKKNISKMIRWSLSLWWDRMLDVFDWQAGDRLCSDLKDITDGFDFLKYKHGEIFFSPVVERLLSLYSPSRSLLSPCCCWSGEVKETLSCLLYICSLYNCSPVLRWHWYYVNIILATGTTSASITFLIIAANTFIYGGPEGQNTNANFRKHYNILYSVFSELLQCFDLQDHRIYQNHRCSALEQRCSTFSSI